MIRSFNKEQRVANTLASRSQTHFRQRILRVLIYVLCIVLAVLFLAPIVLALLSSLKNPERGCCCAPDLLFRANLALKITASSIEYGAGLWRYVYNSTVVAIFTVLGTLVLSLLGGFGFARFSFPGKNILFIVVLSTLMIPFQSILTPLFVILGVLKLQNTLLGLIFVYIAFQLPFGLFLMRNSFETIPRELEESALLDGCTPLGMLFPGDAPTRCTGTRHSRAVRLYQLVERIFSGPHLYESGKQLYLANYAGDRQKRALRSGQLGGAASGRGHRHYPLRGAVFAAATLLR